MALTEADQRAGAEARWAKWRENKAAELERTTVIGEIVDLFDRDSLGSELLQMARKLASDAAQAQVDVSTSLERKQTAEAAAILHKMARLELGESTANTISFSVSDYQAQRAALDERLRALADPQPDTGTQ